MNKPIYSRITAHKGVLVIEHEQLQSNEIVTSPFDSASMGFVITDTSYVGISDEAYALLKTVRRGTDSIGYIDIFRTDKGPHALATIGGKNVLLDPKQAEASRQYHVPAQEQFQRIENLVPEGAQAAIEGQ